MLQAVLRNELRHSTVLTIAHRLETIMDSNRVMVLDDGKIVEFDPPNKLLAYPDSAFSALAREHKTRFSYYIRRTTSSSSLGSAAEPGVEEREI
jgi:ABC-type multidrug transport system fused ATPase/permease subunit